jgi:hypothetical protein
MGYNNQTAFLNELDQTPMDSGNFGTLSPEEKEKVLDLLRKHKITSQDFIYLYEKPGYWGYTVSKTGTGWHWKLRQVRNTDQRIFDVLQENDDLEESREKNESDHA